MNNIKIGLFGAGYFGNFHLNNLLKTPFEVIGFFDTDEERAKEIELKYDVKRYSDPTKLIIDSDALDITTPTTSHYKLIKKALSFGKHIFVEKPMTTNIKEAKDILEIQKKSDCKLQVGHIERYNPIINELNLSNKKIVNIEANRLFPYNPRGTDVSVVFDLMIHDIDLVLHIINSDIQSINASGYCKYGKNIEFSSANIMFKNGSTATLNSSILHPFAQRDMKIWTDDKYYEVDLGERQAKIYNYLSKPDADTNIIDNHEFLKMDSNNSILEELNEFYNSIKNNTETRVPTKDGFKAVEVAETIINLINGK